MKNLSTVQKALTEETNNVVFISSESCSICHVDEPKARKLAEDYNISFHHMDIMHEPRLAGFFEVLTVPAVLVYHDGKEIARQARFIDFKSLEKLLQQLPKDSKATDYQNVFT
ncbi:thioredoxin family protein [Candidatus Enterococcus murrayae]|uniref:Thioredoxin family protein n=1 Tax=Candidatus Enterococcus murrayae TaxID=2815321 RepID=A0ABS3HCP5_9ENTE|nr:thioredoxin family protein [Enterococcus sp. MJM16]MBO0451221.1 thioredoxin family protein [Enterococcus sp. MJM16]